MTERQVTKYEAKTLIDDADCGMVMVGNLKPKSVLGEIDPDEHEYDMDITTAYFGGWEAEYDYHD